MLVAAVLCPAAVCAAPWTGTPARVQSLSIEAKAEPGAIGRKEEVTYVLTVENASLSDIDVPDAPSADGLEQVSRRPSIRRDFTYRNGSLHRSVSFRWTYRPRRPGTTHFDPVRLSVAGSAYRTARVGVRVLKKARHAPPGSSDDEDHPLGGDDVFIRATSSKDQLYRGEQATVTYRLFYRNGLQLRRSRLAGAWDAPGVWREELDVPSRPAPGVTRRNGRAYKTLLLKRVAVFPTRAGTLKLAPLKIETQARLMRRSRGLLGRFFSIGQSREIDVSSDPVRLRVRPLPDGAPSSFDGAVGDFRLDLSTGRTDVGVGEAVQLTLRVSGYGNLATLEAPPLDAPDSLATYDPQNRRTTDRSGKRVRGTKTFTYTLVPRAGGTFEIPPLAFSYFDPEVARYRTLRTRPVEIRAAGSAPERAAPTAAMPPGDLAAPMSGPAAWTRPASTPLYRRYWPYAALALPLLAALGLLAWRRRTAHTEKRPSQAHPTARRRLKQARRHLRRERPRLFYEEVERALLAFIGQRLGTAPASLTRRRLRRRLTRAGAERDTQQALFALLDECDRARFAPVPPDRNALETASARAHRLVAALDAVLPGDATEEPPDHLSETAMHPLLLFIALLALMGGAREAAAQPAEAARAFEQGNRRYAEDDYTAALERYEAALATGYASGALYYNMAGTHYRSGQIGQAVRYYEKARRLLPESERLRHNLRVVRSRTGAPPPPHPAFLVAAWQQVTGLMSATGYFALGLMIYLAALALWVRARWNPSSDDARSRTRRLAVAAVLAAGLLLMSVAFGASAFSDLPGRRAATLDGPLVLRQSPAADADSSASVPEGTVVRVLERRARWTRVRPARRSAGWLPADALGDI